MLDSLASNNGCQSRPKINLKSNAYVDGAFQGTMTLPCKIHSLPNGVVSHPFSDVWCSGEGDFGFVISHLAVVFPVRL